MTHLNGQINGIAGEIEFFDAENDAKDEDGPVHNCNLPKKVNLIENLTPTNEMRADPGFNLTNSVAPLSPFLDIIDHSEDVLLRHSGAVTKDHRRKMIQFISSSPHVHFANDSVNDLNALISEFRSDLPCPKCNKSHPFVSQNKAQSQFKGSSSKTVSKKGTCSCSSTLLFLHLPFVVISAMYMKQVHSSKAEADLFLRTLSNSNHPARKTIVNQLLGISVRSGIETGTNSPINVVSDPADVEMNATAGPAPINACINETQSAHDRELIEISQELIRTRELLKKTQEENIRLRNDNSLLRSEMKIMEKSLHELKGKEKNILFSKVDAIIHEANPNFKAPGNIQTYADIATPSKPQRFAPKRPRAVEINNVNAQSEVSEKPVFDVENFLSPNVKKPEANSDLVFIYFKNLPRRAMSEYRKFFDAIGFQANLIRDIMFCSDNVIQLLTYENVKANLIEKVLSAAPGSVHIADADPCDPSLYSEFGSISRETVSERYFQAMARTVQRFRTLASSNKTFTRTLRFLERVLETKNFRYKTPAHVPRQFLMSGFFIPTSQNSSPLEPTQTVSMDIVSNEQPLQC